jgi:hypothetical protein
MALPKISHPTFVVEVPSTKKNVTFRPFLVKEEKLLLMAKASGEESDMLATIKQIVNNCAIDEGFDVNKLSLFDMEYLFIKIRASSVSDIVDVSFKDLEDEKIYDFSINLNQVVVKFPDNTSNVIKVTDDFGITMKYPQASLYDDKEFLNSGEDSFFQLIIRCIDKIYNGDEVIDAQNYTTKDLGEFIEDLDVKTFELIRDFIVNPPTLYYMLKYKNSLENDKEIELRTLSDFFTLR